MLVVADPNDAMNGHKGIVKGSGKLRQCLLVSIVACQIAVVDVVVKVLLERVFTVTDFERGFRTTEKHLIVSRGSISIPNSW